MPPGPYRFHAFEFSYFSAKVRPALRYKRLWYEELRADLGEIVKRTGLGFIPIVVTPDDTTWQDSTEIYDRLEEHHPDPPLFPATPVQRIAAHLIELYSDEFATIPAMHYRWGNAEGVAAAGAAFGAVMGDAALGNAAAGRMSKARLALGATDATAPAIEAHTRDLLDALSAHLAASPYLLGERMSFADCALMGPFYGHFFHDPVPRRLLFETAVPVVGWVHRSNYPNAEAMGAWPADDALPEALPAVLEVMGRDAAPVILDGLRAFDTWADANRDGIDELPRAAGNHRSTLRGLALDRFVNCYTPWLLQRTLDDYARLDTNARARVDAALAGTGWEELLRHTPRHRLTKRDFKLVFAPARERPQ